MRVRFESVRKMARTDCRGGRYEPDRDASGASVARTRVGVQCEPAAAFQRAPDRCRPCAAAAYGIGVL